MARDYARNRTSRRNARTGVVTPRGGRRPSSQLGMSLNKRHSRLHLFLSLATGAIIGLIIAGIIYVKYGYHETSNASIQVQEKTATQNKAVKLKEKLNKKQNPQAKEFEKTTEADPESEYLDEEENALADADEYHEENYATSRSSSSKKKTAESNQQQYEFYTMLPKDKIDETSSAEREKSEPKSTASAQYQLQVASMTKFEDADHLKAQLILQGYNANISKQVKHGSTRFRVIVGPFESSKAAMAQQQNLKKSHINSILMPV